MATAAEIRAWAREKNLPVGTRGTLPGDLILAYNCEHPEEATQ